MNDQELMGQCTKRYDQSGNFPILLRVTTSIFAVLRYLNNVYKSAIDHNFSTGRQLPLVVLFSIEIWGNNLKG